MYALKTGRTTAAASLRICSTRSSQARRVLCVLRTTRAAHQAGWARAEAEIGMAGIGAPRGRGLRSVRRSMVPSFSQTVGTRGLAYSPWPVGTERFGAVAVGELFGSSEMARIKVLDVRVAMVSLLRSHDHSSGRPERFFSKHDSNCIGPLLQFAGIFCVCHLVCYLFSFINL